MNRDADIFAAGTEHETIDPETGIVRRVDVLCEVADIDGVRRLNVRVIEDCADKGATFLVLAPALKYPGTAAFKPARPRDYSFAGGKVTC